MNLNRLDLQDGQAYFVDISQVVGLEALPYVLRVLLENLMRQHVMDGVDTSRQIADLMARKRGVGLNFFPSRIFGQDILGKVMMADMAALRGSLAARGRDPTIVNPTVPVDIIIDHSLQVDVFGTREAPRLNLEMEYRRNGERFAFLRWCSESFENVRVVPPGKGIMHQIHIEAIAEIVRDELVDGRRLLTPDTCIGTDSHTPMVNGLGVLGWGVGGIEAEAVMLGKSIAMALPRVIGVEVTGRMAEGVMPTDLVLTITQTLRVIGVVGEFVEFFGAGLSALSVADRCMIANMAPEYGATAVYFPVDRQTMDYLKMTARPAGKRATIEAYARAQKLWREDGDPVPSYDQVVQVDLGQIRPSIAGPRNPEDRIDLDQAALTVREQVMAIGSRDCLLEAAPVPGKGFSLGDGDLVIAAITSCTNTSNPVGMIAAGLVARKAVALGLRSKPWVKTSLAPGSQVVSAILERCGLQNDLDALGFHVVGYGCTTCNGGSGPLAPEIAKAISGNELVATAVLSGNRNFQGRIHPNIRAAYLASPALVVAYALAGSMLVDLAHDGIAKTEDGRTVRLADIWPSSDEISSIVATAYTPDVFAEKYADLFDGGLLWDNLLRSPSALFPWQEGSTYVKEPPYFEGLAETAETRFDIHGAYALAILGHSITTDDISPSGAISLGTPSADFLLSMGVKQADFNNYTTRRAHHDVAIRATFANIRLKNRMVPGVEGGFTALQPDGNTMRIFEAAQDYARRRTPLIVIAGKNYGCGSSRDWAAKGVALMGVKAVVAEGFERIHRSNLVGMGVLPLQFMEGVNAVTLALDGTERFDITGLDCEFQVLGQAVLGITRRNGEQCRVPLVIRLDTPEDIVYWRHGGILPFVWRDYMRKNGDRKSA